MELDYLKVLNPEQKLAVLHSGSPLLILAGAGSGKTRVITTKIAYLIQEKGIPPYNILAVTFTKKAATEMKERAVKLEKEAAFSQIRTFHSFGSWFLRKYASYANLDSNFTVYDDDDSLELLKSACPFVQKKQYNALMHDIFLTKDYCLTPEDENFLDFDTTGYLEEGFIAYHKKLRATGNVDFGDLIYLSYLILKENPEIQKQMQYRFKVVMVDEYQDSNVAQFKLLEALVGSSENSPYLCVVGDDDQSIYKFRGAEVKNILQFPEIFPNTQIIRLEKNYRSTEEILNTADIVIKKNTERLGKTLQSQRGKGSKPVLAFLENQNYEAEYCAKLIYNSILDSEKENNFSDWAILYRTNAQSLSFEKEFLRKKIPYVVVGALKFFQREEVKDLIAWLEILINPRNEVAFKRIINKPTRGIGEKTQNLIIENAQNNPEFQNNLIESSKNLLPNLSKKAKEGLENFLSLYKTFSDSFKTSEAENDNELLTKDEIREILEKEILPENPLSQIITKIAEESGLIEFYKSKDDFIGSNKIGNIEELANSAEKYEYTKKGLLDFLDTIELDRALSENQEETTDAVTLITLHNTKGLEFNKVIITGMEAGIFPKEGKTNSELEEERRLFYVGITRARDELYLTSCRFRTMYGRTQEMMVSPFIIEAGNIFKVMGKAPSYYKKEISDDKDSTNSVPGKFIELAEKFKKGTNVYNDDFGYGQIFSVDFSSSEFVVKVKFETGGIKTYLPEYQKSALEIIKNEF